MIGETSVGGVFMPTLLLIGFAALMLTGGLVRVVGLLGLYRYFAYRALVDLCLFVILFGLLAFLFTWSGIQP